MRPGLSFQKNKIVFFTIALFITYVILTFIPEFTIGRRLRGILTYGALFLCLICSLIGIVNMIYSRKINYLKLFILCFPIIYLVFIILMASFS